MAPALIQNLALADVDDHARLYDVNYESAEHNMEFGNWVRNREEAVADWHYEATDDLGEALSGADIVNVSTVRLH